MTTRNIGNMLLASSRGCHRRSIHIIVRAGGRLKRTLYNIIRSYGAEEPLALGGLECNFGVRHGGQFSMTLTVWDT